MLVRNLASIVLALGLFVASTSASADDNSPEKSKTLVDRIDDLGRTLFGGVVPEKASPKPVATKIPRPAQTKTSSAIPDEQSLEGTIGRRRAGSVLEGVTNATPSTVSRRDDAEFIPENTPPTTSRRLADVPRPIRRSSVENPPADESGLSAAPSRQISESPTRQTSGTPPDEVDQSPDVPTVSHPTRPLHERLSAFRESVFNSDGLRRPTNRSADVATESRNMSTITPNAIPRIAERVRSKLDDDSASLDAPSLAPAGGAPVTLDKNPEPIKLDNEGGVLFARKGPELNVKTIGPRRISVGKESVYEVNVVNSGESAAEELVVFVSLPEWAEVVGAESSVGAAQVAPTGMPNGTVQWKMPRLDVKGHERLSLRVVPRESRPFDLAVRWEYKPIASQAMIEVQEPKLLLQLEGPREVLFGKKEVYRLKLTNMGNGAAEDVAIMLMPIGSGENVPATYKVGTLAAGEERALDVELTARQAGNLTIQVEARADGSVHAELAEKVVVRRAVVKIDLEGPKMQYVGAVGTYTIRVRNPGTAAARNVNLAISLPAGAKYLSGIESARVDSTGGKIEWAIENLTPGTERNFTLKCSLGVAGISRVQVIATADDDLSATATSVTQVEAVANLAMDVRSPEGPVAVGDEVAYEVHVRNRGTKEASNVEIFTYFSRGVEPISAEGAPNRIGAGQVVFLPIPTLAPGAEAVVTVHARADAAGNHVFRSEAHCKPLGVRLVNEAANLYYADMPEGPRTAQQDGGSPVASGMK
jgi:uncharacterized repeat protein (TIGR01451 family)